MRKNLFIGVMCFLFVSLISCEKACVADVAVTDLVAVGSVANGEVIDVDCTIKNVSCGTSNEGRVFVEMAFSLVFGADFSDYQVFSSFWADLQSFGSGGFQYDDMQMRTDLGAGYYSMKVTTNVSNDEYSSNNTRAITIQAN